MAVEYKYIPPEGIDPQYIAGMNTLLQSAYLGLAAKTDSDFQVIARNSILMVTYDYGFIAGMGCLVPVHSPSRFTGILRDIIVDLRYADEEHGFAMCAELIAQATRMKMENVVLEESNLWQPTRSQQRALGLTLKIQRRLGVLTSE